MITIDQLLESVDLDFEPRWVTKDEDGRITIWKHSPKVAISAWIPQHPAFDDRLCIGKLKLAEFADKDWQECIYEVPRKVDYTKWIGKLCRFWSYGFSEYYAKLEQVSTKRSDKPFFAVGGTYWYEHCEPVRPDDDVIYKDAVNELKVKGN